MGNLLKSKVIIQLSYMVQMLLLAIGFYLFTSKITIVPWHSPLTTYVLLHLLILVVLEFLLFIFCWRFSEYELQYLKLRRIALIHLFILLSMSLLSILHIQYFIFGCVLFSTINLYLIYMTFLYLKVHLN